MVQKQVEIPNLNQLMKEWEHDASVDLTDPGGQMIKIPNLHSKYNGYLSRFKLASIRKEQELDKLKKQKWLWVNGKLSKEELDNLGWEQLHIMVLKPDQQMWLDADDDIQKLKSTIALHDECVSYCVYVMKEIASRTYQIKEWMQWSRLQEGGGK